MNFGFSCLVKVILALVAISTCSTEYSISFYQKLGLPGSSSVSYNVKVNGETQTFGSISFSQAGSGWIDFDAEIGDVVNVYANHNDPQSRFAFYYLVNNGSNGGGTQIYDSRTTIFTPRNTCTGASSCPLYFGKSTAGSWESSRATIFFNGVPEYVDYAGGANIQLVVEPTDVITVEFTFSSTSTAIGYFLAQQPGADPSRIEWYYNSYGTDTLIANHFPISSPFGGQLYPISPEQEDAFSASLTSGGNTRWI